MKWSNSVLNCSRVLFGALFVLAMAVAMVVPFGVAHANETELLQVPGTPDIENGKPVDPAEQKEVDIAAAKLELSRKSFKYTGAACEPEVAVELNGVALIQGVDYEVAYADNVSVGKATLTVSGKGLYQGTCSRVFTIKPRPIANAKVAEVPSQAYNGKAFTPKPLVTFAGSTLVLNRDYTMSYKLNKNAGKATIILKGKGNFTGQKHSTFTIKRASLKGATVSKVAGKTYRARNINPKPVVKLGSRKLKLGRDYTLSYKKNRNVGVATVVVKGAGNFKGTRTTKFAIKRASVESATVSAIADRVYSGKYFEPKPAVRMGSHKLELGRDYTLSFKRNRDVGQGQVIVRGAGNYKGKTIATFNILDWVSQLNIAQERTQLIIVEAEGTEATVSMHVKVNGLWQEVVYTREGYIGYDGLGDAREGVAYTPMGILYPDIAFGICGDPGCKMGYTQVDWSHYWCGDSYSDLYNQLVSTYDRSDFNVYASEHLASMGYAYNYCLNMGWNAECTPYGGSAFFLHCSTGSPTEGCVAIPEWAMIDILCTIEPGCAIVIDTPEGVLQY